MTASGEDRQLIAAFLEMMAAEAGAARNTLLAYARDLNGASEVLGGGLASASPDQLKRLGEAWMPLKRATVARKAAALRRFFGFLAGEKLRADDPSEALPRPVAERPLPKILDHRAVDALFAALEKRKAENSFRRLGGRESMIDFSSNDYLGFSSSRVIFEQSHQILSGSGLQMNGATGSRLLTGNHSLFETAENLLCRFHQAGSALVFNSGYDANIGFFSTVPKKEDVVLYDEYIHASIRDGIRMGVAASYKFRHNDLLDLESKLKKYSGN